LTFEWSSDGRDFLADDKDIPRKVRHLAVNSTARVMLSLESPLVLSQHFLTLCSWINGALVTSRAGKLNQSAHCSKSQQRWRWPGYHSYCIRLCHCVPNEGNSHCVQVYAQQLPRRLYVYPSRYNVPQSPGAWVYALAHSRKSLLYFSIAIRIIFVSSFCSSRAHFARDRALEFLSQSSAHIPYNP
jgi:hypothetical protein